MSGRVPPAGGLSRQLVPSAVEGQAGRESETTAASAISSALEGCWIEVFRAGDYGERGHWTPEDLDRLAASYDPRLQPAPVVLGHPADDAPAYGWVRRLRRAGQALWAQLEKVDPSFEALLRTGRFRQRSVSLYKDFPPTSGPYLRHLGFLGAAAPAVKGLAPVRFAELTAVSFAFEDSPSLEMTMSEPKSKLDSFLDHLRSFFTPQTDSTPPVIPPAPSGSEGSESEGSAFSERLAVLEQRLDTLAAERESAEKKLSEAESGRHHQQVASFVESLRRAGRFPPAFERWGVVEFMERLAALESMSGGTDIPACPETFSRRVCLSPTGESADVPEAPVAQPLTAWFHDFLTRLPAMIEFAELGSPAAATHRSLPAQAGLAEGGRLVRFTEPQRGMSVDPASIELAERAEALAAELGISYAQALTELRQEQRHTATTA